MADINVERRGARIWPWILGLLVAALLIWALTGLFDADDDDVVVEEPAAEIAPSMGAIPPADSAPAVAEMAGVPASQILANPSQWAGRTVQGEVTVVEAPDDRRFWVEAQGERILLILEDGTEAQRGDINAGQTLRLRNATVHESAGVAADSVDIDNDTRALLQGQTAFLQVNRADVEVVEAAAGN